MDAADDEMYNAVLEEMEEEEDGTHEEGVEHERKNHAPEKRIHLHLEISSMMMVPHVHSLQRTPSGIK
eukprot:8525032-Ditylum_brightwellii.AAC.1